MNKMQMEKFGNFRILVIISYGLKKNWLLPFCIRNHTQRTTEEFDENFAMKWSRIKKNPASLFSCWMKEIGLKQNLGTAAISSKEITPFFGKITSWNEQQIKF